MASQASRDEGARQASACAFSYRQLRSCAPCIPVLMYAVCEVCLCTPRMGRHLACTPALLFAGRSTRSISAACICVGDHRMLPCAPRIHVPCRANLHSRLGMSIMLCLATCLAQRAGMERSKPAFAVSASAVDGWTWLPSQPSAVCGCRHHTLGLIVIYTRTTCSVSFHACSSSACVCMQAGTRTRILALRCI